MNQMDSNKTYDTVDEMFADLQASYKKRLVWRTLRFTLTANLYMQIMATYRQDNGDIG